MSRSQKLAAIVMTVLSGVAIYGFFAFRYPYHLHFQEQYQLFESTWDYFAAVAAVPGGFADWAGRFVTQFCYYAPVGAVLMAVLLCGVQLLTWAACRRKTLTLYALSFLPSVLLLAFYCDENALAGAAVALILSLAAAVLIRRVSQDRLRLIVATLLVPVLYMACGPLMVVYILLFALCERNGAQKWFFIGGMVGLAVLCPFVSRYIFPYPMDRLYAGVHYYRYHNILPGLLWMAAVASVAVVGLSCLRTRQLRDKWKVPAGSLLFLLIAAFGTFLTLKTADFSKEEWMRYDFMVRMQMWNRIMLTADRRNPDTPKTVSCLNLALSKSGRMADSQFEYFQNGPDGLLPPFVRDHTSPVSTSEIFWQLGMVNTAQRYAFEAQEAIPDFQKSARLYQRLVETNIVNGDWDVARKYLKALQHARFYRKWARETRALLDAGTIFERRPELARARKLRLKDHDFLFSDTEMDSMLGLLNVEHPENTMALEYLMAWALLKKDLDRFVECIGLLQAPQMPKAYQEALLLRWVMTHSNFEGLPPYLSRSHARRINAFLTDMQSGKTEDQMRQAYGDTYWFYYYYRYRTRPE
jgi:hypothetical protein